MGQLCHAIKKFYKIQKEVPSLGFSYPSSVTVSEPVEYTDFKDFLETLFESMYNTKSSTAPQAN